MKLLKLLFTTHPAAVGETYAQHFAHAVSFGASMLTGALACFVHAAVPAFCTTTGSSIVARLYTRMITARSRPQFHRSANSGDADFIAEHI